MKREITQVLMCILVASATTLSQTERDLESKFLAYPSADSCRRNLFILTQEPHMAGSRDDSALAVFVNNRFREYGINSQIVTYYVYLPYPKSEELEMTKPEDQKFDLREKGWSWDKDSYNTDAVIPFNSYSPSGDLTCQIVYANYGLPEDYEYLESIGVDVRGKIMLVRYGRSFRGIKVKVAEEHHAAGVIIYSDPADDGYMEGDVYPRGPMRPKDAVQRGSIQDLTIYPGDPLTPGYASTKDAKRIPLSEVTDIPHLPCLPISYGNAEKLLENLSGPPVPDGWQGALPFHYHIGPGGTEVHMKIDMDYEIRPIWDVIGTIAGSESPNEKVIIGNHRDAWVYGAVDPNSGTASLLETARGLGELLRSGWQPKRTIVLCSWDGEEFGLIGSTEWGEQNAADLSRNAVAYVNVDAPVSGTNFGSSAVPSLDRFVMDITKSVSDPKTGKSVFDVWYMNQNKNYFKRHTEVPDTATTRLGRLGSGSDYTVFLDHLGVPSFDFGFGGPYGVYHSMLDDFYWMEHWGDPTFEYHATVARLIGIAAMRLADDRLLPLRYSDYAEQISNYLQERKKKASENDGVKGVSFSEAESSTARFVAATRTLDSLLAQQSQTASSKVNAGLMEIERTFTNDAGLPQSPWFKHQIYAPGFYTGYGSEPLPGIDRAIDSAKPGELEGQLKILFDDLGNASNVAERLITELEGR